MLFERVYDDPVIYRIPIPLVGNPLKTLNCYVIKTEDRSLIIDTGFNRPECQKALLESLEELSINTYEADLFLTHMHSDHIGLCTKVLPLSSRIYMSKIDRRYLEYHNNNLYINANMKRMREEGLPDKLLHQVANADSIIRPTLEYNRDFICLEDGNTITLGDYTFTCILTPGHTPGHMCLYEKERQVLFLGDHVLFDITPNITNWPFVQDSLGDYLDSLQKIKGLSVKQGFAAHRRSGNNLGERIDYLIAHHRNRLTEIVNIIEEESDLTGFQIASKMTWHISDGIWEEIPIAQKWFALGETVAHLDHLVIAGAISKTKTKQGVYQYSI